MGRGEQYGQVIRSRSSRELGSIQCRSSHMNRTGSRAPKGFELVQPGLVLATLRSHNDQPEKLAPAGISLPPGEWHDVCLVVMGRNALDAFGQQIAGRRMADVAQTEDADHPLASSMCRTALARSSSSRQQCMP